MLGVFAPFSAIASRRQRQRVKRMLVEDGRYIELNDAMRRHAQGDSLFLAEFTKDDCNIWLVPVTYVDAKYFDALPTHRQLTSNEREVIESLLKMDQDTMDRLVPALQKSARVSASLEQLLAKSSDLSDSIRVLHFLQLSDPTRIASELASSRV
jgi:hypothetical protein